MLLGFLQRNCFNKHSCFEKKNLVKTNNPTHIKTKTRIVSADVMAEGKPSPDIIIFIECKFRMIKLNKRYRHEGK